MSTPAGAEGLGVTPGRHLLVAGSPADFAADCARVMRDPALRRSLASRGAAFAGRRGPGLLRACLSG